jgi:hypothetical protein
MHQQELAYTQGPKSKNPQPVKVVGNSKLLKHLFWHARGRIAEIFSGNKHFHMLEILLFKNNGV